MTSRSRAIPRSTIERTAARQARDISGRIGGQLRIARQDAGLSLSRVASAGGLSKSRLHDIEAGGCQPRWETIARVSSVLGLRLSVVLYPDTGPLIRDHIQSAMLSSLLAILHVRWRPRPEVSVYRPVRGVIDLVLDDMSAGPLIACEAQSELRRIEQQLRSSRAKADALAATPGAGSAGPLAQALTRTVSRVLLLRSTVRTRAVVAQYGDLIAAAYPARTADVYAALTGEASWPGDAILWCRVDGREATVLRHPPRGIAVGR